MTCDSFKTGNTENMQALKMHFTLIKQTSSTQRQTVFMKKYASAFLVICHRSRKKKAAKRGGGGGGTRVIVLLGAIGASKMCIFFLFFSEITHREVKTKECV